MNRDSCVGILVRKGSGGPGMIEMYVSNQDPIQAVDTEVLESCDDVLDGGLRSRFYQGKLISGHHERSGDAIEAVHACIDDRVGRHPGPFHAAAALALGG
jgi:hypothetical protein